MLKQPAIATFALLAGAVLTGCSDEAPQTAQATIEVLLTKLHTEQDPGAAWDLLPQSYRRDLQRYCRRIGKALPGAAYDKLFLVLRKAGTALKANGENIPPIIRAARTRMLGAKISAMLRGGDDTILDGLESAGNVLILVGRCEISTKAGLQTCNLAEFLHGAGRKIWTHSTRAFELSGRDLTDMVPSFATVSAGETRATLRFTHDHETWDVQFVRVEGAWIPQPLADAWPRLRTEVEALLAELEKKQTKQLLARSEEILDAVLLDLEQLQEPISRTRFGNLIQKIGLRYAKDLKGLGGEWIGDVLSVLEPK